MYVTIGCNPENGADIQDTSCGVSGIMIILKIVKGLNGDGHNDGYNDLLYDAKLLLCLVKPWCNTDQLVSAYYYFASVFTAELVVINGLKFFDFIKTSTIKFSNISYIVYRAS